MALAKPGKDQDYMKTVVEAIDDIIKVADDQSFKQVTALIAPLRKAARDLEDKCKVVAELPESEKSPPEKPGADPLDTLGLEAAAKKPVAVKPAAPPGVKPAAPAEGKPPGAKPAAPAPAPAAPTAPAKPETPPAQPAPPAAK
jgi:translation initiation factor IF-2